MKCPNCSSSHVIKKGKRKTKYQSKQRFLCKNCKQNFFETTEPKLNYKEYPPVVISAGISLYNLGYPLREVSKQINKRFKINTGKSTVHSWVQEFHHLCPISKIKNNFSYSDTVVFSQRFEHENLEYLFMYHKYKLNMFAQTKFPGLTHYITGFEKGCPDVFFQVGKRCSQPNVKTNAPVIQKKNLACEMAAFAIQSARNNRERHKVVEQFLLINDLATVACEVPVWYWEKTIDQGVTGHIDIIQVRNNLVYILDYKPDAVHEKKAPWQLYHYAVALSFRTKIPLGQIRCAWFDSEIYYEYSPLDARIEIITKT